jgi:hypothetical protein
MIKAKDERRILARLLAKEFTEEQLKQVSAGTASRCGGVYKEYDDTEDY